MLYLQYLHIYNIIFMCKGFDWITAEQIVYICGKWQNIET